MGNFYVNYTLGGVTQEAVAKALAGRTCIVTPSLGDTVVAFDEESDNQDLMGACGHGRLHRSRS